MTSPARALYSVDAQGNRTCTLPDGTKLAMPPVTPVAKLTEGWPKPAAPARKSAGKVARPA